MLWMKAQLVAWMWVRWGFVSCMVHAGWISNATYSIIWLFAQLDFSLLCYVYCTFWGFNRALKYTCPSHFKLFETKYLHPHWRVSADLLFSKKQTIRTALGWKDSYSCIAPCLKCQTRLKVSRFSVWHCVHVSTIRASSVNAMRHATYQCPTINESIVVLYGGARPGNWLIHWTFPFLPKMAFAGSAIWGVFPGYGIAELSGISSIWAVFPGFEGKASGIC